MQIGRLKLAWDRTASILLTQLESCDLVKIWLRYQHLSSQDGPFCAFRALFFKLSPTQMPKSIRLYLCNNSSKVGHIIYHWKAMDSLFPMRCQAKRDSHAFDFHLFFTVKSSYSNILATFNTITITQN